MAEPSAVERALRAELAESRALIAELRLSCVLYADQVVALRELEREWSERDRLWDRENRLLGEQVAQLQARLEPDVPHFSLRVWPPTSAGY